MKYYTDEELLDGFIRENLTEKQKEIFLDRAQHKEFVSKFIKKLEEAFLLANSPPPESHENAHT